MNKYLIKTNPYPNYSAGYKAISDIEYFLEMQGFISIPARSCLVSIENCLDKYLSSKSSDPSCDKSGIIIMQYPEISYMGLNLVLLNDYIHSTYKNIKTVILIQDVDSIRFGNFFTDNNIPEISFFNTFDYAITLNSAMAALLKNHGAISEFFPIELVDYIVPNYHLKKHEKNESQITEITVAYAGNLHSSKSPFIYELPQIDLKNIEIMLYGDYCDSQKFSSSDSKVKYHGCVSPNDLPNELTADFGLSWDGTASESCGGKFGKYLKYTNPHKISLYLTAGIPVVLGKEIALAPFIEQENLGIAIESLYDLPEVLNNVSAEKYNTWRQNAINISAKLRAGFYTKQVIKKIENTINNTNM